MCVCVHACVHRSEISCTTPYCRAELEVIWVSHACQKFFIMHMYLAFFIGMLLPLKWDYSPPVMYPLLSKRGWFFAWNTCMQQIQKTFRMYADIISRGVYAKCNLQIICEMFCNHSWLLACVYAFLKALALDLRVMIIILQNFQDLGLSDFLHVLYCLISCIYVCVQLVLFSLLLSHLFAAEPLP